MRRPQHSPWEVGIGLLRRFTQQINTIARVQSHDNTNIDYACNTGVEHRQHRYLNNRAENSHQPTRQRERRMGRFKSSGHAQRFRSAYERISQHCRPRRHRRSAPVYRQEMRPRFHTWREILGLAIAA